MNDNTNFLQKLKKPSLIATVTLLSLSAAWGIFLILCPPESPLLFLRIIGTTTTLGVFFALIVSSLSRLSSNRRLAKVFAWITIVTSFVAALILLLMIWGAFDVRCDSSASGSYAYTSCYSNWQWTIWIVNKILWICVVLAFATAINGRYLDYQVSNSVISIFRNGTLIVNSFLGIIFVSFILFEIPLDEFFFKSVVIGGILLVLGLIVTPILVMAEKNHIHHLAQSNIQANEQSLRAKIEQEVRAQIAAEERAKTAKPTDASAA